MDNMDLKYSVVVYGSYYRDDYFDLLEKSSGMIYLSTSESQGIALSEAWIRNVPVLAWDRGFMEHDVYYWSGKTGAPYLTESAGLTFQSKDDFPRALTIFLKRLHEFTPRSYAVENFTDAMSAQQYIDIINELV